MNQWNQYLSNSYLTNPHSSNPFWANYSGHIGLPYSTVKEAAYRNTPSSTFATQSKGTPPPSDEGAGTVASNNTSNSAINTYV